MHLPANRQRGGSQGKRMGVGEKPGLSGAAFFDLYTDPLEESGKMLPTFPAKGMLGRFADAVRSTPNRRAQTGSDDVVLP